MSVPEVPWRYGVAAFVASPVCSVASYALAYLAVLARETSVVDLPAGFGVGLILGLVLLVGLGFAATALAAVAVLALYGDARQRTATEESTTPLLAAALGVVHVAGALLTLPSLLSVPAGGYYVYRRRATA